MKLRKAQLEILGLVIIVMLILLGIVFAIKYVVLAPPSSLRQDFLKTQLAANMISSMLSTTTNECYSDTDITDLIIDCYKIPSNRMICENNKQSCEYLSDTIEHMLDATLKKWNKNYEFLICDWDDDNEMCMTGTKIVDFKNPLNKGCQGDDVTNLEQKQVPLPIEGGEERFVLMTICN